MIRETSKIKFSLLEDQIVQIECEPNTTMTLAEGKESTRIVTEMIQSTPLPMLCDLTNVVTMTKECRQHFAGPEHAAVFTKCALLIKSPIARVIGNFFLGANKPLRPTRLFTDKEDALEWLRK